MPRAQATKAYDVWKKEPKIRSVTLIESDREIEGGHLVLIYPQHHIRNSYARFEMNLVLL